MSALRSKWRLVTALLVAFCAACSPITVLRDKPISALGAADSERARSLAERSSAALARGDFHAALLIASEGVAWVESASTRPDTMLVPLLTNRGIALTNTERFDLAIADFRRALTIVADRYPQPAGISAALHIQVGSAIALRTDGRRDYAAARAEFDTALSLYRQRGRQADLVRTWLLIATAAMVNDDRTGWGFAIDEASRLGSMESSALEPELKTELLGARAARAWFSDDYFSAVLLDRAMTRELGALKRPLHGRQRELIHQSVERLLHLGRHGEAERSYSILSANIADVERLGVAATQLQIRAASISLTVMADGLLQAERSDEAAALARRARVIGARDRVSRKNGHSERSLRVLAEAEMRLERYAEAETLLRAGVELGYSCGDFEARLADVIDAQGRRAEADQRIRTALREIEGRCPIGRWQSARHIAMIYARRGDLPLAIFFGKGAVLQAQEIRQPVDALTAEHRLDFLKRRAEIYYLLAAWLAESGRLQESKDVLDLLKLREVQDAARGDASTGAPAAGVPLTAAEAKYLKQPKLGDALQSLFRDSELRAAAKAAAETSARPDIPDIALKPNDVHLVLWQTPGVLHLLIRSGAGGTSTRSFPARSDRINQSLAALESQTDNERVLSTSSDTTLAVLKTLHGQVWAPFADQLASLALTDGTVYLSLHGGLRAIPFAALHDGRQFLVERYRMVLLAASTPQTESAPRRSQLAGFAATGGFQGLSPLRHARQEVDDVIQTVGGSRSGHRGFVDREFSREALFAALQGPQYARVHVASHFALVPGDQRSSFLMLGDGTTATASDVSALQLRGLELLVLSACKTAVPPDDRWLSTHELESFAGLLKGRGVGRVVGSLWSIDDLSTSTFMKSFYGQLRGTTQLEVADALRAAQLMAIRDSNPRRSHPFAWAPFVLIGDPARR